MSILDLLRPTSPEPQSPGIARLLAEAQKAYPFITQYKPVVTGGPPVGQRYAETWQRGDEGTRSAPRPATIPLDRTGVEVYRPDKFGPTDLAAEFLHADPYAHMIRNRLWQSLSPSQTDTLKHAAGDYRDTLTDPHSTERDAMRNAVDSAMRGYTVGQWPAQANAEMRYTPQQSQLLNALQRYMTTGRQ